jgi:hypothetical protein
MISRLFKYSIITLIILVPLVVLWYFFAYVKTSYTLESKIAICLGVISIFFGLFQFILSLEIDREKSFNQMRVEEYRQIRRLFQEFINTANNSLSYPDSTIDSEAKIINLKNEIVVTLKSISLQLFKDIENEPSYNKIVELTEIILSNISKYNSDYQNTKKNSINNEYFKLENIRKILMNNMREPLNQLINERSNLLTFLQSKIH